MKIKVVCLASLILFSSLPNLAHSARWWQPDDSDFNGGGMDLDSYRTFTDSEGYEVTSIWFRDRMDKAESVYNPNLGKKSITSAFSLLVQMRCDTGELKLADFIFQDRQYNDLWRVSDYPEFFEDSRRKIGEFYYPSPSSQEAQILSLCDIKKAEDEKGFSIQDFELDEYGHVIGFKE